MCVESYFIIIKHVLSCDDFRFNVAQLVYELNQTENYRINYIVADRL